MGIVGNLSPDQLMSFQSQGYLVLESFTSPEEINAMRKRMDQLLDEFDCSSSSSIFSTKNQVLKSKLTRNIRLIITSMRAPRRSRFSSKQPGIGGEVVPHQDNSFLYTEPTTCTGLWLALEDATILNGCLWAIPGSHKGGLVRRFTRDEEGVHFDRPFPSYEEKDFVPLEVKAGSLVVIHGDLIHQSFENQSSKSRHAYSFHAIDTVGCKWAPDNWIRRKVDPEPLYVS